jgi:hypothetical protein
MKVILSALLALTALTASASGKISIRGTTYDVDTVAHVVVGPGTTQTSLRIPGVPLNVFYITIDVSNPSVSLRVAVAKDKIPGIETPSAMAKRKSDSTHHYFAGVNGDFFDVKNTTTNGESLVGRPYYSTIVDGEIYKSSVAGYQFVVDTDKKMSLTQLNYYTGTAQIGSMTTLLKGINVTAPANGITIYTPRYFSDANMAAQAGSSAEVTAKLYGGDTMTPGGTFRMEITSDTVCTTGLLAIPSDGFVLHGHGSTLQDGVNTKVQTFLKGLKKGDIVTFTNTILDSDGNKIYPYQTISGNPKNVGGGVTLDTEGEREDASALHPRTAIGYTADGKHCIMMVVDGRTSLSAGVRTSALADIMRYAGASEAVNLDGGGSSTLYTSALGIRNHCSGGYERSVGDAIFAVLEAPTDNTVASIQFADFKATVSENVAWTPVIYGYNKYGLLVNKAFTGYKLSCDAAIGEIVNDGKSFLPGQNGTFTITATYGSSSVTIPITITGYVAPEEVPDDYPDYVTDGSHIASNEYILSDNGSTTISGLSGKTVKRVVQYDGKLYILAYDSSNTPSVTSYDTATNTSSTLDISTITDGTVALSDIAMTSDGVLVAMNKATQAFGGSDVVKIYKWLNVDGVPNGKPSVWFTTNNGGNWTNGISGESMCYTGSSRQGAIYYTATTTGASANTRIVYAQIADGEKGSLIYHMKLNNDDSAYSQTTMGDLLLYASPNGSDYFYYTGATKGIVEFKKADEAAGTATPVTQLPSALTPITQKNGIFRYAGHSFIAGLDKSGIMLDDVTYGLGSATEVTLTNAGLDATSASDAVVAIPRITTNSNGEVLDSYIDLAALHSGKVTMFTTGGVQKQNRAALAYDLAVSEDNNNKCTITFKSSGDAKEAVLILTDANKVSTRRSIGEAKKGINSYTFDASNLEGNYTWAIELHSQPITQAGIAYSKASTSTQRGGVVPICDSESANYGYTAVANGLDHSVDIFNPAGDYVGNYFAKNAIFDTASNQSSPFRGSEIEGNAVFADLSDKSSEIPMVNPTDLSSIVSLYPSGCTKSDNGLHTYNGVAIGGGQTAVAAGGSGSNLKLYTFEEDLTTNKVVRYDLGTSRTITAAPNKIFTTPSDHLANANVDLLCYGNGFFASQLRSSGNNSDACPGFLYADANGTITFNSSTLENVTSCNSGIAITPDGKKFAVSEYEAICIYDVTWSGDTPKFTYRYKFPIGTTVSWSHMRFDAAGNLHVYQRENEGYKVYSLPDEDPTATTPAPANLVIKGKSSGIEDVAVEDVQGDAIYYNVQGRRVLNPSKGIYIKVTNGVAQKVALP